MKQLDRPIPEIALAGPGDRSAGLNHVQDYLSRFGYLDKAASKPGLLDDETSAALSRYQAHESLPATGAFDEKTRRHMSKSRCALPDLQGGVAFVSRCAWDRRRLTYAFGAGTPDVSSNAEFAAVRAAFQTWVDIVPLTFTEVTTGDHPDIVIEWRSAADADLDMTGPALAHADFPLGCGVVTDALPKPVHFDDSEHAWAVGAVVGRYDIETVALHEIGHLLGLQHSTTAGAVMQPTVDDNVTLRVLTADDVDGARRLYPPLISFRSANYHNRFIRHRNFVGELTEIVADVDRMDGSFRVMPGLADPMLQSFESVNLPGHFLRHQDFALVLQPRADDQLFREDATFHLAFGLADPKGVSLRSFNFPERFIRHRDFLVYLEVPDSTSLFWNDATFFTVDGLWQA